MVQGMCRFSDLQPSATGGGDDGDGTGRGHGPGREGAAESSAAEDCAAPMVDYERFVLEVEHCGPDLSWMADDDTQTVPTTQANTPAVALPAASKDVAAGRRRQRRRVLVMGKAGAGKSAVIRYLAAVGAPCAVPGGAASPRMGWLSPPPSAPSHDRSRTGGAGAPRPGAAQGRAAAGGDAGTRTSAWSRAACHAGLG
eukprot:COSAG01_NODE_1402_length_10450_cov_14.099411_3_plen_198_part_00